MHLGLFCIVTDGTLWLRHRLIFFLAVVALVSTVQSTSAAPLKEEGIESFNQGDYQTALTKLKPLAEKGDREAQYYLGVIYSVFDWPQHADSAIKWYSRAAEQGHPVAQYQLGYLYEEGDSLPQDFHEAYKWYEKSAKQCYAHSQYAIAKLYRDGKGVLQDYILAYAWMNIAATSLPQNEHYRNERDALAAVMTVLQLAQGQSFSKAMLADVVQECDK